MDVTDVTIETLDPETDEVGNVMLVPTSLRIYGRLLEQIKDLYLFLFFPLSPSISFLPFLNKGFILIIGGVWGGGAMKREVQPQLELAIHSNNFQLIINEDQEKYFKQMIPLYQRWYHKLDKEFKLVSEEFKEEIKEKLEEGKKTALIVATKLAEKTGASEFIEKAKVNAIQAVEDAVKR